MQWMEWFDDGGSLAVAKDEVVSQEGGLFRRAISDGEVV